MRAVSLGCLVAAGALLLGGCGGPPTASVSGSVQVDGQPLKEGSINFVPEGGAGPTAGGTITDGKYQIGRAAGLWIGKNKVEIRANRKTGKKIPNAMAPGRFIDEQVEALPPEYNTRSTLIKQVVAGANNFDFDLHTTKK
jgi:hypothetical protein